MTHRADPPFELDDEPEKPIGELEIGHTDPGQYQAQAPVRWNGRRSDTSFRAYFADNMWILGVYTEAEKPVLIQNAYLTEQGMWEHADNFDLGLSVAKAPEPADPREVAARALALQYVSTLYRSTGKNLSTSIAAQRHRAEVTRENRIALAQSEDSAAALTRIADRIDAVLASVVSPDTLAHLRSEPPSRAQH